MSATIKRAASLRSLKLRRLLRQIRAMSTQSPLYLFMSRGPLQKLGHFHSVRRPSQLCSPGMRPPAMRCRSERTKCFRTQKTSICNEESSPGISDCVLAGAGRPATVAGRRDVLNKTAQSAGECDCADSERSKSDAAELLRRPCATLGRASSYPSAMRRQIYKMAE